MDSTGFADQLLQLIFNVVLSTLSVIIGGLIDVLVNSILPGLLGQLFGGDMTAI